MNSREKLEEFAELRGWNKNKLIGWSAASDFGDWLYEQGKSDSTKSVLEALHKDLQGFKDMGFLPPDVKSGLGIAIEQVERYIQKDLEPNLKEEQKWAYL